MEFEGNKCVAKPMISGTIEHSSSRMVFEALKAEGKEAEVQGVRAHKCTWSHWLSRSTTFLNMAQRCWGPKRVTGSGALTLEKKLKLVGQHRKEYGLNRRLRALSMSKSTWHRHQRRPEVSEKDKELKKQVTKVVEGHPVYGYRRIKVELEESYGIVVNHKRLRRCLREWELALKRQVAQPRPSGVRRILKEAKGKLNLTRGRKPEPFQVLYTDFTETKYAGGMRKAYLMAMIDPGSGWVAGWAVGKSANRELALRCWEAAKENLAKVDQDPRGLIVHHDQDTVYTSHRWLRQLLIEDKVVVSYLSEGQRTTLKNP